MHWQPLMLVALAGAIVILLGIGLTVLQLVVSIRQRRVHRDRTGDPWNGRTLEWSTPSPPPAWNFGRLPVVEQVDAWWQLKHARVAQDTVPATPGDLHIPRNTPVGVFLGFFAVVVGFDLIWRINWLAVLGLVGALVVVLRQSWSSDRETRVSGEQVAAVERSHATVLRAQASELAAVDGSLGAGRGRA
jgi:cytochrome o ubiquinol oxidase subunit 1